MFASLPDAHPPRLTSFENTVGTVRVGNLVLSIPGRYLFWPLYLFDPLNRPTSAYLYARLLLWVVPSL
jgi:hypothetical protein